MLRYPGKGSFRKQLPPLDWCWSWSSSTWAAWCLRAKPLEKDLMLGKIEDGRRRGWQRVRFWMVSLTLWTWVWASSGGNAGQGSLVCCSPWGCKESDTTEQLTTTTTTAREQRETPWDLEARPGDAQTQSSREEGSWLVASVSDSEEGAVKLGSRPLKEE